MKKNFIVATLVAAAAMTSASVFAADGQINFTGSVTADACTVTNKISAPLSVNLGKVSKDALGDASGAGTTKFSLALSDCPDGLATVNVKFDGTTVPGNNQLLALTTGTGVATGVGIRIADSTQQPLALGVASVAYPVTAGSASMDFTARYIATGTVANVNPGKADSTATFTINYN